mgnify:CR=1 FL=1
MNDKWIPEIMYEANNEGTSSSIPFIMVPKNEKMPKLLYVFESRETGEMEPGLDGTEVPVCEWDLHQYADMAILKEKLDRWAYDIVRDALGLDSMVNAVRAGKKISQDIRDNINNQ